MKIFDSFESVLACVGQEVAKSSWISVPQERIDQFAKATEDHQWIHTDALKAACGPFKTTIAHGFLSLSLVPRLFELSMQFNMCSMGINYGLNRVRFTDVLEVNSRIMGTFALVSAEELKARNGLQSVWDVEINKEGGERPVCVAQCVLRHYL